MSNEHTYAIGEEVIYVNDYGVYWGKKTIIGHHFWYDGSIRYFIDPTDTPWYPHPKRDFYPLDFDFNSHPEIIKVYGRPRT